MAHNGESSRPVVISIGQLKFKSGSEVKTVNVGMSIAH